VLLVLCVAGGMFTLRMLQTTLRLMVFCVAGRLLMLRLALRLSVLGLVFGLRSPLCHLVETSLGFLADVFQAPEAPQETEEQ